VVQLIILLSIQSFSVGPIYTYDVRDKYINHFDYDAAHPYPSGWNNEPPNGKTWTQVLHDYDEMAFVSSLQGIVNQNGPILYVYAIGFRNLAPPDSDMPYNIDHYWLNALSQSGEWLNGTSKIALSWSQLLDTFGSYIQGLVVWDPNVPASMNVAFTIAGCDRLGVVRYDTVSGSLYNELRTRFPVVTNLVGYFDGQGTIGPDSGTATTRSAKNDAYRWAVEKYVDTGKCNPAVSSNIIDGWNAKLYAQGLMSHSPESLFGRDALVAKKAFLFDLSPFTDVPNDDPAQPAGTDKATMDYIFARLKARYPNETHVCSGFPAWESKYSNAYGMSSPYHPVTLEWKFAEVISKVGVCKSGTGCSWYGRDPTNLSFHYWAPRPRYPAKPKLKTPQELLQMGYLLDASNILVNAGFEDNTTGSPWVFNTTNRAVYSDSGIAHSGLRHLQCNTNSLTSNNDIYQDVTTSLAQGDTFTAKIWTRCHEGNGGAFRLVIWAIGSTSTPAQTNVSIPAGDTAWRQVSVSITIPASGYTKLRLQVYLDTINVN